MTRNITQVIQTAVLEGDKPAKQVALEVNKPYPTLLREINPYDSGAKVGVESLVPIMRATGSLEPLAHLARSMGHMLVPMLSECSSSWQTASRALEALEEIGDLSRTLRKCLMQGKASVEEFSRIEQVGNSVASATLTLIESMRDIVKKGEEEAFLRAPDKAVA